MSTFEIFGYVASALVLATFCMRTMVRLRLVALVSNVAFLVYGLGLGLKPVFLLHFALLGINAWRLAESLRTEKPTYLPQAAHRPWTRRIAPGQRGH